MTIFVVKVIIIMIMTLIIVVRIQIIFLGVLNCFSHLLPFLPTTFIFFSSCARLQLNARVKNKNTLLISYQQEINPRPLVFKRGEIQSIDFHRGD